MTFHEVRFPTAISSGASGGPERRTEIVTLGSGFEERNSRWAESRRSYNAGYGVKDTNDLHAVIAFFEERRARLYGFRWKDFADFKSCAPLADISPLDQALGEGDGVQSAFQLRKTYGGAFSTFVRTIKKPVDGTVRVAIAGAEKAPEAFSVDHTSGIVTFASEHLPAPGETVTAGFEFDVPVRFDTDALTVNLDSFRHGSIPNIPIIEVRL